MTDRPKFTHGGARPGAGRKPRPPVLIVPAGVEVAAPDMLRLLQDVALGRIEANATQVRAAVAALRYTDTKELNHD